VVLRAEDFLKCSEVEVQVHVYVHGSCVVGCTTPQPKGEEVLALLKSWIAGFTSGVVVEVSLQCC